MKSSQPRKQRKFRFSAPLHKRRKMVFVHLSHELKEKLGTKRRSIQIHKGDKVKIMRGKRKNHTGKVVEVNLKDLKVYIEGATARTAKGVEKLTPIDPSNLLLLEGEFAKDRLSIINRSAKISGASKPESK